MNQDFHKYSINPYRGCEHNCSYCDGKAEWYGIDNFGSHIRIKSDAGIKFEKELASRFGSDLYDDLSGNFRGHTMHFAHHIGVSQVFHYRTTPLSRELLTALCNQKSLHNYEWTVRSHAHYVVEARYKTHRGIITPAWQMRTHYTIRKSPFMVSDIGAVRFYEVNHETLGDEKGKTLDVEVAFWRHPKPDLVDLENRTIINL